MTTYRVDVIGPQPATADEIALMLTSAAHYETSDWVVAVERMEEEEEE